MGGLHHVLGVAEEQEHLALTDGRGELPPGPEGLADRPLHEGGVADGASETQNTPARKSGTSAAAASTASRVSSTPPGPERVTRRAPSPMSVTTSRTSVLRPTKELGRSSPAEGGSCWRWS